MKLLHFYGRVKGMREEGRTQALGLRGALLRTGLGVAERAGGVAAAHGHARLRGYRSGLSSVSESLDDSGVLALRVPGHFETWATQTLAQRHTMVYRRATNVC